MILNDQVIHGTDHIAEAFERLKEPGHGDTVLLGDRMVGEGTAFPSESSEIVWECHGWNFVCEFIDNMPRMDQSYEYCFSFKLKEEKHEQGMQFALFMISAMLLKEDADKILMGCVVERSDDEQNHFVLLKEKTAMEITEKNGVI